MRIVSNGVQPYIVQTGVDTDGESQEEVATFRRFRMEVGARSITSQQALAVIGVRAARNALESELDLVLKGGKQKTRRHLWPLGNVSKHSSEQPTSNTHILGFGQVICLPWTFKGSGQEALPSCRLERHVGGWVHKLKGREMDRSPADLRCDPFDLDLPTSPLNRQRISHNPAFFQISPQNIWSYYRTTAPPQSVSAVVWAAGALGWWVWDVAKCGGCWQASPCRGGELQGLWFGSL
ncbi:hypothetical protein DPX16_2753 [Anabarilius grahami]|uniref:Uncharacterized protein n=1 Tax=Anabarilius grahami TaxID=495550 RepID=A0A3N0XTL4_ANAGA|nr:hypothetical protein DPX16_2753 [Anabarilius grahami]